MPTTDPRWRQVRFNLGSRDQWAGFADHRARVSGLLAASGAGGRLAVLGAGNANDLDLPRLLASHREVHLVDLDDRAIEAGATRQGVRDHPGLRRWGGLDLTGGLDLIARWSRQAPVDAADLRALVDWPAARVPLAVGGPFDAVASTCLLSQIIGNAHEALGEGHPQFAAAVRAIRLGHLRLLARLARPGGVAWLITDVVSTDHVAHLRHLDDRALAPLIARLGRDRGTIHGVNPADVQAIARTDPDLAAWLIPLDAPSPWRWDLHDRTYLVWATRWHRR